MINAREARKLKPGEKVIFNDENIENLGYPKNQARKLGQDLAELGFECGKLYEIVRVEYSHLAKGIDIALFEVDVNGRILRFDSHLFDKPTYL